MKRREFLKGAAAAGAGLAIGGSLLVPRRAWGAAFADFPSEAAELQLPKEARVSRVLEIYLYGGLSPWETFYIVPEYGRPEANGGVGEQWWTFQEGENSVPQLFEACRGTSNVAMLEEFAVDANMKMVNLGPFVLPLRQRSDLLNRLRLLVTHHEFEPHEGAVPLAMSGQRLGSPKLAGLGAAFQRYFAEHGKSGRPFSYVLHPGSEFPTDNLQTAFAVGLHPPSARPLTVRMDGGSALFEQLERAGLGTKDQRHAYDTLVRRYIDLYTDRLKYPGQESPVRAARLTDLDFARRMAEGAPSLQQLLAQSFFTPVGGEACEIENRDQALPAMSLRLAAHLLKHPSMSARYVMVVDGGLVPVPDGGGYDTHSEHIIQTAPNITHLLASLAAMIREPGDDDPAKLDLDDTLVILNTEFGRTPGPQFEGSDGRNHWPYGYVTAFLGGPIGNDQKGVVGAIGPDGRATGNDYVTPAETRAAALLAMNLYPFEPETFGVADIGARHGTQTERDGIVFLRERLLGRPT